MVETSDGKSLAVAAEGLYLINLMLLPGLAFVLLLGVYLWKRRDAPPLAANHLAQTLGTSILGGTLLVAVILLIALLGGFDSGNTWVFVVFYFTFIHSSLIFMGILGLVRALAGQHYRYPLLGRLFRA